MKFRLRWPALVLIPSALAIVPTTSALVTLEDGKDQVFVDATAAFGYSTNVFSNNNQLGSLTDTGTLALEFVRRAGWIGVNVNLNWDITTFGNYHSQDFMDPSMSAELTKETGRTTGALTLSAKKEDRADVNVGTRDVSWNYDLGVNARYPVIDRYSLTGTLDYGLVRYDTTTTSPDGVTEPATLFTNLNTYSASLDLYYILSDERDLFAGYRYRYSQGNPTQPAGTYDGSTVTSKAEGTFDVDHSAFLGVSGRIIPEVNGSLQAGVEERIPHGNGEGDYRALTASGSACWNLNRQASLTWDISKDFSMTAAGATIDSTTTNLTAAYAVNAKLSFTAGVGVGDNFFLGPGGVILNPPNLGQERRDYFFTWNAAVNYTFSEHLKTSLSYNHMQNWSNLTTAVFMTDTYTLTLSSRW